MGSEIELKLLASEPGGLDEIYGAALAYLYRSGCRVLSLRSVYLDTSDGRLRQAGYSLRIRDDGDGFLMTAKGPSENQREGIERGEWERRVASADLDRSKLHDVLPEHILANIGDLPLEPLFVTEVERQEVTLTSGQSTIEIAVDRGRILAGSRSETIAEVELELKKGDPSALYELALDLTRHGALIPCSRSKSDRGFDLAYGQPPAATKASPLQTDRDCALDDIFTAVFRGALAHLIANLPWIGKEQAPEALHQARVALRRMRSAFAILKKVAWSAEAAELLDEAKWLAGEMGPARDWDVLVTETIPLARQAAPGAGGYDALVAASGVLRQNARDRALQAATGIRCSRFLLKLGLWSSRKDWRPDATPEGLAVLDQQAGKFAPEALGRLFHKVNKRGRHFDDLDAAQRHAVRIAVKKLRYAGDFLFPILSKQKRARRFARALSTMQDALGRANDMARTEDLLGQLAADTLPADANRAVGAVLAYQAAQARRQDRTLSKRWREFAGMDVPWKGK